MRLNQRLLSVFALLFAVSFTLHFYAEPLYNSAPEPEERIFRWQVLERALGPSVPESPNLYANLLSRFAVTDHWHQRLPIAGLALLILLTALSAGDLTYLAIAKRLASEPPSAGIDRLLAAYGIGMGLVSLGTQFLGLCGWLTQGLALVVPFLLAFAWIIQCWRRTSTIVDPSPVATAPVWLVTTLLLVMTPFTLLSFLAACLPTTDYDALAYHLLGPKEYFLQGKITFLPHNIYTSFPFFTEMFSLLGMTLADDWFLGGLVGQVVLWSFGPMTAVAIGRLGGRLFGAPAGWLAAAAYLTTPWVYRLSVIPYVEGAMLFYGVLAIDHASRRGTFAALLAGAFSGCAMACKYPGLLMVLLPAAVVTAAFDSKLLARRMAFFLLGSALFIGPWLLRNLAWTGNPVYPLAYSLFGGMSLDAETAERFSRAHAPADFTAASLYRYAFEVVSRSDWQSGILFAFAPLALLHLRRRIALALWGLVLYLFIAYWGLTHRLDRFWLPLEPFLAILAGAGMTWKSGWIQRSLVTAIFALTVVYNLAYCSTALCGLPSYTIDLQQQRAWNATNLWPAVGLANDRELVRADETVLFLGFAGIYDSLSPARYNTVFDENLLLQWSQDEHLNRKPPAAIRQSLKEERIDVLVVDWNWIDRYRAPGNYGFPELIQPSLFDFLVESGVLQRVVPRGREGRVELYRVMDGEGN